MKLSELKKLVDYYYENEDDLEVVILTSEPSIGPRSSVSVRDVSPGFDWDSGSFFICAKTELVEKNDNYKELEELRHIRSEYLYNKSSSNQTIDRWSNLFLKSFKEDESKKFYLDKFKEIK